MDKRLQITKLFLELLGEVEWLVDKKHYGDWDIYYDNDYDTIVDRYAILLNKINEEL